MTIQLRRGTATAWADANPVLAAGEPGYDRTNTELRIGNGVDTWSDLPAFTIGGGLGGTLELDDIDGLVAALDGKAAVAGDTFTGNVTINGADLYIEDAGKAYRFRRGGGALDFEATGADMWIGVFEDPDFIGAHRVYLRLEHAAEICHAIGQWQFTSEAFAAARHTIDPNTGTAALGSKNSLANIVFAGRRATAGPPTTGTWATSDLVLDVNGAWWQCTSGGTPGTWASPSGYVSTSTTAGTTYTIAAADIGTVKETTSGSAVAVTVPQLPAGATVEVCQYGAGQITFAGDTGVTVRSASGLKTRAQYSCATLRWRSATEAVLAGDLTT